MNLQHETNNEKARLLLAATGLMKGNDTMKCLRRSFLAISDESETRKALESTPQLI